MRTATLIFNVYPTPLRKQQHSHTAPAKPLQKREQFLAKVASINFNYYLS